MSSDLAEAALAYAARGLEVFPLAPRSKVPLFKQAHPEGDPTRATCKGACGRDGHGVLDATTDLEKVAAWWAEHPHANIGGAVPAGVLVLDVDPRHDGHTSLRRLIAQHGPLLPPTLRARSGGPDQGTHLWWRHPGGKLRVSKELPGLDLRIRGNYLVIPPSIHPSGGLYAWIDPDIPVADPPAWLIEALRPPVVDHRPPPRPAPASGTSIADWFTASTSWWDILGRHGWHALDPAGTRWKHPTATSALSATVTNDCLFVYSTSTPLEPTAPGDVHGYTRFRAWAALEHGGDLSAAARAARRLRQIAA